MENEEDARIKSSPNDVASLDIRTLDWIEDEANLICDIASLDATFEICNTREHRNRRISEDSFLYSDLMGDEEQSGPVKSAILPRKEEVITPKRGWFTPKMNAMTVSLLAFVIFSFFFDAQSNHPVLTHFMEYRRSPETFAGSSYIIDHAQANHSHYTDLAQTFNLIFVYSHMSLRSRKWIDIINTMERMTRYNRNEFGFYTCRCFDEDNSCHQLFGLQAKTPAVVLYHKGRYYQYAGRLSIDHVWSWIERMMSPIEIVYDLEDYYKKYLKYDITFTAYFPFENQRRSLRVNRYFPSYERVALDRITGTPDSHRTRFLVVLNRTLAEYLKVDDPGTILFQSTLGRYEYLESGWSEERLASYVFHWDRSAFRVPFMYKGIHPDNRYKIQSNRYFTKLTNGSTVILFTRHDPLYYPGGDDITAFREIALEYNDCNLRPEWQWRVPKKLYHPRRYAAVMEELQSSRQETINKDRQVFYTSGRVEAARSCCKEINSRHSMRSICSCCQEESINDSMRKVWNCGLDSCTIPKSNMSDIFDSPSCGISLRDNNRDDVLMECCGIIKQSERPGKLCWHEERRRKIQHNEDALRALLGLSLEDPEVGRSDVETPRNMTIWKYGCKVENTLRFVIVDTRRTPSLARRLGVNPRSTPRVAIVDAEEERVALMDWQFSRQSLRQFIASFHTGQIGWSPMSKGEFPQHSKADSDREGRSLKEGERLTMIDLDYDGLMELTQKTSLIRDSVLFLTGGASHAASMALNFHIFESMLFFKHKNISIDFYSFDITLSDLPYNFKMNRYPSVYFLPADRPLHSFEFPRELQFTSSNLVYFALASLSDTVRWESALSQSQQNPNLIRYLRKRIEETERILRRRSRLSRQFGKRLTAKLRASRLLLTYLHESNSDGDFSRFFMVLQQFLAPDRSF